MLVHNADFLPPEATRNHVDSLNRADARSIDTEWEITVLHGLSTLGQVQYEIPTHSGSRPDIRFMSQAVSFTGDIVTINDSGVAEMNPWVRFQRELVRRALKAGLSRGFHVSVGVRESDPKKRRRVLALPRPAEFGRFFGQDFDRYLASVKTAPDKGRAFEHKGQGIEVVVTYDPASPFFGADFHAYDSPHSPTDNPLYRALKRKHNQLREAPLEGPTLIFACDGGSRSLRSRSESGVSTDAIVARFLKDYSVTGVIVLTVEQAPFMPLMAGTPRPYLKVRAHSHPRSDPSDAEKVRLLCAQIAEVMPTPAAEVANAFHDLQRGSVTRGHTNWGGLEVTENSVRLSARGVLELLAGAVTQDVFQRDHGFTPSVGRAGMNPLAAFLRQGRLIERVEVEHSEASDDDWLILHFGKPDPAVARFVAP